MKCQSLEFNQITNEIIKFYNLIEDKIAQRIKATL